MRLKRLSIKGFKSFADPTDIHFNENLIGIVGPNGSGKSNIVDSIRWVLGEQKTSELRLDSMSDVIFNGTKKRKEGKIAKVTLSFDNTKHILPTEFNEVNISRILYRNGNSEYQLNNVHCRKKDITNLFIDSGIGSNSYAIISLNMVEDILHDNGGSRRHMIEQAAGISKYKIRKKETLSKLRSTSEDLDRVQDLLFEIEKNMTSFERQAKRTERFNRFKEEYKDLSVKISHIEVKELSLKYKELKQKLEQERDTRLKINTELTGDDATLQKLKTDILQSERSLSEDQQQFNLLIEELGKVENEKNLALQRLQSAKDRISEITSNASQLETTVDAAKNNLSQAEESFAEIQQFLTSKEEQFESCNKEFINRSQAYEDLRKREKEIKSAISANQLHKETLLREIESFKTRKSILESDIVNFKLRISELQGSEKGDQTQLNKQEKILSDLKTSVSGVEEKIEQTEKDILVSNNELSIRTVEKNKKQVEHSTILQRIRFLQNIIENNEGLPESVKFILSNSGGKYQVLSDVIEITDERYTKIVELYIESFLHHILVKNRQEAILIYEKVRDAQKGKINIVILEEIGRVKKSGSPNGLMPLGAVINVDKEYQHFVDLICEDVFIADQSYKKTDVSEYDDKAVVLFPDEYLVLSQGKLYGGSNTLFEGVQLGRRKLLEKLEKKSTVIQKDLVKSEADILKSKSSLERLQEELRIERAKLSDLRQAVDTEKPKLYEIQNRINNKNENVQEFTNQISLKTREHLEVSESLDNRNKRYEEVESQNLDDLSDQELTLKIETAHKVYLAAREVRDVEQGALFDLRSKYNMIAKDVEFYQNNIGSVLERLKLLAQERGAQETIIKDTGDDLLNIKKLLEEKYTLKAQLQEKLNSYEDTYYKEKGRIFELEKKIGELRNNLYNKDQLITTLNEKYTTIGFDIKGIHERNSIEFGIQIDEREFPEEYEGEDLEELKNKKSKILDRIRSYGEINPMAITAYNEIKERHNQISKERDDIVEAMASLQETISEIEKSASERFHAALAEINKNFKSVFQALFSEDDDCDIVLLDNDDPLEAKIEIVAKPKGKRPKSINLLSGGEKTLTAASFLFALYLLKPAPFCIFDEVDAPLDDVNILKFNRIIRQFSKDSQFIIITHNKLTMSEVDILYGVYLKELGISGVSAVDFRTYDQTEMALVN